MKSNYFWSKEEEQYLLTLVRKNPFNLRDCFRNFNKEYPNRSLNSVRLKYYKMIDSSPKKYKVFLFFGANKYSISRKNITSRTSTKKHEKKLTKNILRTIWDLIAKIQ